MNLALFTIQLLEITRPKCLSTVLSESWIFILSPSNEVNHHGRLIMSIEYLVVFATYKQVRTFALYCQNWCHIIERSIPILHYFYDYYH